MKYAAAFLLALAAVLHAQEHPVKTAVKTEYATLGGGCFWCTEAALERLPGVLSVTSGYAGGATENPTYEEVCAGRTGHAEVVRIAFDPAKISYENILAYFWKAHDPTTLNRQGADTGTQYRSIILTENDDQARLARESKKRAQTSFQAALVTEIAPLTKFYPAESYHQNFSQRNPSHPYNIAVIQPKLEKLQKSHTTESP